MSIDLIKSRAAQHWPRVFIGLISLWGLYGGISALWLGVQLNRPLQGNHKGLAFTVFGDSGLGPEEEDRMIKISLITVGVISTLVNGIGLYASVRKSIWATKTSLVFWIIQIGWLILATILFIIAVLSMSDKDREQLPKLSARQWFSAFFDIAFSFLHGWALLVFLRDLKQRPRNAWGRLVRTGGVFEYEPIAQLQI
ncbi:hypothetical protein EMPS_00182 [Entomortierella parvispora]|uniref:Uncharacterized protein n=1 Tax=Entomortierella parvispora TaxID=205924 RepID=A0A9P3GZN6_9FUNG|nr:hypothetical protein EMPS_00182 [Entomortierella parvispora]